MYTRKSQQGNTEFDTGANKSLAEIRNVKEKRLVTSLANFAFSLSILFS